MSEKEKDKERNYVAEAQNWEARVKGELDSARNWEANWGELYHEGSGVGNTGSTSNHNSAPAITCKDRIANLEVQIKKLPVTGAMTTNQMSYTVKNCTAYEDTTKHRRKTGAMQQSLLEDGDEDMVGIDSSGSSGGGLRRPEP